MRKNIVNDNYQFEVLKNIGEGVKGYGYHLNIYKNDILIFENGSFGSITMAELNARDYFLLKEFNIEREE